MLARDCNYRHGNQFCCGSNEQILLVTNMTCLNRFISNTETKQMYDITNIAILGVSSGLSAGKWLKFSEHSIEDEQSEMANECFFYIKELYIKKCNVLLETVVYYIIMY